LVPHVLTLAVSLDGGRVLFAISPPIVRVAGAPFLRTVPTSQPIFRVGSDFLAVVIGAAAPLATGFAAYGLPRLILRWLKDLLTVAATPLDHTGVVAPAADGFSLREI